MNFQTLAWYDAHALAASLQRRNGLFTPAEAAGHRVLNVRLPKPGEDTDAEIVAWIWNAQAGRKAWPELHNLLGHMRRDAAARLGGEIEHGRIYLDMLDPGATLPWHAEAGAYFEQHARCILALRSNPGTMLFCGTESLRPEIGYLNWVNVRAPCSAVNFGDAARVYLVVDSRKKPVKD